MDTVKLDFIGPFEIGVWGTPAGELFEDGQYPPDPDCAISI